MERGNGNVVAGKEIGTSNGFNICSKATNGNGNKNGITPGTTVTGTTRGKRSNRTQTDY